MSKMQIDLIKDFRRKDLVLSLAKEICKISYKPLNIMEICGGHTHAIMKYALSELLPKHIRFIHGPGCPVCILGRDKIDNAISLAKDDKNIICSLGDLLRIPGSTQSLQEARANGANVRVLYSPLEALQIAKENPSKNIIFFAIGFETTVPMSAVLLEKSLGLKNFYFYSNHVLVPPPTSALLSDPDAKIDALLGPSHVSVIIGEKPYEKIVKKYKIPLAISGFEPVDILASILNIITQANSNKAYLHNEYKRVVRPDGNALALAKIKRFFTPIDFDFRGLGVVKGGGLGLKEEFAYLDASKQFSFAKALHLEKKSCLCPAILRGKASPNECSLFGTKCTPKSPVGACMVSAEGACAAYYKYRLL